MAPAFTDMPQEPVVGVGVCSVCPACPVGDCGLACPARAVHNSSPEGPESEACTDPESRTESSPSSCSPESPEPEAVAVCPESPEAVAVCPDCPAGRCGPDCPSAPPVPLPTYRWELVRRDRQARVYPWTHVYKPPLRDADDSDHEYEPISPPAEAQGPPAPPAVHVTNIEGITIQEPPEGPDSEPIMTDNESAGSPVRRPVDEVAVPHDGDVEDRAMSGGQMGDSNGSLGAPEDEAYPDPALEQEMEDEFMTAAQVQQQMEDRFFTPPPTATAAAVTSTSQPAEAAASGAKPKKGKKAKTRFLAGAARGPADGKGGGPGRWGRFVGAGSSGGGSGSARSGGTSSTPDAGPESIQQRLRSAVGAVGSGADRLRTRLSGMSRPRISLPDRSKFHLPDRPSLPKLKMPAMPERPSLPKFKMPAMPDRPKLSLGSLGRAGKRSGGRQHSTESTAGSSSEKRRPLFDLNTFRTYPRMFKRGRSRATGDSSSSPRSARSAHHTRPGTPPARSSFSSDTVKWMRRFSEAKYGAGDPEAAAVDFAARHTPSRDHGQPGPGGAGLLPQPQQYAGANGDGAVYHISLHGTDSEPEYSDDQFPGPPYPEVLPIDGDLEVVDHVARKALAEARAAAEAEAAREAQLAAHKETLEAIKLAEEAAQAEREYLKQAQQQQQQQQRPRRRQDRSPRPRPRYEEDDDLSQEQDLSQGRDQSLADSDRENRSSGESSERHRRGVIEEIDSDEFFLRQKGISQEDVDMGRYIASEIRDALRPPRPSADYADEDDASPPPGRPHRPVRSLPRSRRKKQGKIYVPARAPRATPPGDEPEAEEEDEDWEEDDTGRSEGYFNTFPPDRPARRRAKKPVPATPPTQADDLGEDLDDEDQRVREEIEFSIAIQRQDFGILAPPPTEDRPPPLPPKRLRKSRSSGLNDVPMIDDEEDDWSRADRDHDEMIVVQNGADYIIPRAAPDGHAPLSGQPVPPTRGRKSRGGSRAGSHVGSRGTSLADEDRTSRGAESLPSERDDELTLPDDAIALQRIDDYAFVDKQQTPRPAKPERPRRPKPPRPPAPGRRGKRAPPSSSAASKLHNWRQFFSLPTRRSGKQAGKQASPATPVRPARNYSTLGPARPPRRGSQGSRPDRPDSRQEEMSAVGGLGGVYTAAYLEIRTDEIQPDDADITETESSRADLQSGEVISRMKGRPLPAPPRPTRTLRTRKHHDKGDLASEVGEYCEETVVPERERTPDPEAPMGEPTYAEKKAALAQLRSDFFSRSGEEPPPVQDGDDSQRIPTLITTEAPEDQPLPDSPYKSLRKKKKIPPLPPPEVEEEEPPRPEEVSIAIQTDPLPDDVCVEDAATLAEDASASRTYPTVVEQEQLRREQLQLQQMQQEHLRQLQQQQQEQLQQEQLQLEQLRQEQSKLEQLRLERMQLEQLHQEQLRQEQLRQEQLQQEAPPPPPARRHSSRRDSARRDSQEPSAAAVAAVAAAVTAAAAAIPESVRLEVPESLHSQRLQVSDLDVDRLSVSELRANKITVSEIDTMSLSVSEVHDRSTGRGLSLQLSSGETAGTGPAASVELPSDLLQQLQSMSHSLSQSLSESLASSLSQTLSQIQEALSQPSELAQQQQLLQQQLTRLQELQSQQQQQHAEQLQQHQQFQQQQQQLAQEALLQVEQQHAAVLHELQQQLHQLQVVASQQHPDVPPPIPPPPRVDASSIQTQTSLELPAEPTATPTAPTAPPRGGLRPRVSPAAMLLDSEEEEEISLALAQPTHPRAHRRRPHHHKAAARYSSDEEVDVDRALAPRRARPQAQVASTSSSSAVAPASTPGMAEAGLQLARACRVSALNALAALHQAVQPAVDAVAQGDPKRRDLQAALCLVLVLVAALILLGCGCAGGKDVHHHHWDFQFPPPL